MQRRRLFLLGALAVLPSLAMAQEKQRKKGGGASFLQINTLTGTIIHPDGRRGVMTVEAGVDVPDPSLYARADASMPRLRAAYAEVVMTYAAGLPPYAVPNADYLARELQRQTDLV